jgi:DNA-binding transcriptional MerR regulator
VKKKMKPSLKIIDGSRHPRRTVPLYPLTLLSGLSGLTRRQISYWTQLGLVKSAVAAGSQAIKPTYYFSEEEAAKVLMFSDMRRRGLSLKQIQTVAGAIKRDKGLFENKYVLTDGFTVFYADTDREAVETLKLNRLMLLVPTHAYLSRLSNSRVSWASSSASKK